jgi:hypothetical protein
MDAPALVHHTVPNGRHCLSSCQVSCGVVSWWWATAAMPSAGLLCCVTSAVTAACRHFTGKKRCNHFVSFFSPLHNCGVFLVKFRPRLRHRQQRAGAHTLLKAFSIFLYRNKSLGWLWNRTDTLFRLRGRVGSCLSIITRCYAIGGKDVWLPIACKFVREPTGPRSPPPPPPLYVTSVPKFIWEVPKYK